MKIKKTIIITLFLLCLLMIGTVSASENSTNDIVSSDVDDDIITTTADDVGGEKTDLQEDTVLKESEKTSISDDTITTTTKDDNKVKKTQKSENTDNEIKTSSSNSEDILTTQHTTGGGGVIYGEISNITVDETAETGVVVISAYNPAFGTGEVNGEISVFVDGIMKNTTPVTNKKFPNGENVFAFYLKDLGITKYDKEYYITVKFYDYDSSSDITLCEGILNLTFMDDLTVTNHDVNTATVEYHLANDFKGNITAKLNGEDLGEIFCDSWLYNQTQTGYQIGTLKLPLSKVRLKDNKVIIQANDFVKGVEEREINFDCSPTVIIPDDFYLLSQPTQFFSIGEEFKYGIKVPKEINGTLNIYTCTIDDNKDQFLTSAEIINGTAIATLSLNTEGDNWLYLEYITNKGDDFDTNYFETIVKNSNNITVNVSPTEFIEGGKNNITVSFNSLKPGTLYIYRDGIGEKIGEVTNTNHTVEYLSVGTHIIRVTFISDDDKDYYSKQFTITVKPWTPSGDGTNSSGELTPPKTDTSGTSSQQTTTKKVTQKTIKIIASKKTFKRKIKIKKYTVTLKQGNKGINKATITLKVKGKKYTSKTKKNGKATFKITKLNKKGTYKAVISYKGTKKTVKIIIK